MIEDLDSVQWDQITHAYGSAVDVPDLLRALDMADTLEEFERVYYELWNLINHQGTIYQATSYATRFIIQLLTKTSEARRQAYHLTMLAEFLGHTQSYSSSHNTRFPIPQSIIRSRFSLELYDVISTGIDHYLNLLSDDDVGVQTVTIYVFSFLGDQHERILPALVDCIEQTQDPWLQAAAVWSYARLVYYSAGYQTEPYLKQLLTWIEQGSSFHMRYTAALAHLNLSSAPPESMVEAKRTTPNPVIDLVAQGLMTNVWETTDKKDTAHDVIHYIYAESTPFDNATDIITQHCYRAYRPDTWIAILQKMDLSPSQAHLYCREIMNIAFLRVNAGSHELWHNLRSLKASTAYQSFTYIYEKQAKHYQENKPLTESQKIALEALINCDPFWEVPTNLFSFYYGLPDDRDKLRLLASP